MLTQGTRIPPRAAAAGFVRELYVNELGQCSAEVLFFIKQMIDRVLAAAARLHSPSHYDQLPLFSLFSAIGERCGLISALLDFHNKRG